MNGNKKLSGLTFFILGLLAYMTLGMDLFVILIDKLLWGNKFKMEAFFESPWYTLVIHWSIVVTLWLIGGVLLFRWMKKREVVKDVILINWGIGLVPYLIMAAVTSILFTVFESIVASEALPQFFMEYKRFVGFHGPIGLFVSVFQNIYYFVESMLVVILLALMQRAGELWFKKDSFLYGGIGLLLTWGISHFTKGLITGLWICGFCIVAGWLFKKVEKHWWPSLLFIWLAFFI